MNEEIKVQDLPQVEAVGTGNNFKGVTLFAVGAIAGIAFEAGARWCVKKIRNRKNKAEIEVEVNEVTEEENK